jgi:hypothetical protein
MDSVKNGEVLALQRLSTVRIMSSVLTNEFLFCLLWLIDDWNRPMSLKKLSSELRTDERLLKDHLYVLSVSNLIIAERGKYRISERGKEALAFLREATGKIPSRHRYVTAAAAELSGTVSQAPIIVGEADPIDLVLQLPSKAKRDDPTEDRKTESPVDVPLLKSEQEITASEQEITANAA